jgi:hydroxyacylglutathione hydrolase
MALEFKIIPVTPFAQNCSVVWCTETNLAAVIDPGGDLDKVTCVIQKEGLELDKILITHAHLDHAGGTAELARFTGAPIIGPHRDDQFWIDLLPEQCSQFGFDGDSFTPGHVVFVEKKQRFAAVGDVIFQGSIGRSDVPKSNPQDLLDSIRQRLLPLGDDIRFLPGHGPMSTFGQERQTNPFVADSRFG